MYQFVAHCLFVLELEVCTWSPRTFMLCVVCSTTNQHNRCDVHGRWHHHHNGVQPCPLQRKVPVLPHTKASVPCWHVCRQHGVSTALMAQHQCSGVKVCHPPPCSWSMHPPLLTSYAQGKPPCCTGACDTESMVQPGYHLQWHATATMTCDQRPPATSPPLPCLPGLRAQALHPSVWHRSPHSQHSHATTPLAASILCNHNGNRRAPPVPPTSTVHRT